MSKQIESFLRASRKATENLKKGFVGGSSEKKTTDDTKPIDTLDNPLTKKIISEI